MRELTPFSLTNLAGQKFDYLRRALRSYQSGERKNDLMNFIASDLSPADIDNLATYFSRLDCR